MGGRQNHRDIDADYDAARTSKLREVLARSGYIADVGWNPVRMELCSDRYGFPDMHPFVRHEDGSAKQADLDGGWYAFGSCCFKFALFSGRNVPGISLEGQKIFHAGYDLRDKDLHDLAVLAEITA